MDAGSERDVLIYDMGGGHFGASSLGIEDDIPEVKERGRRKSQRESLRSESRLQEHVTVWPLASLL